MIETDFRKWKFQASLCFVILLRGEFNIPAARVIGFIKCEKAVRLWATPQSPLRCAILQ